MSLTEDAARELSLLSLADVIRLDTEEADVIALEEAARSGIPAFIRRCSGCGERDLSQWFLGRDHDLGAYWQCRACGKEDEYEWAETTVHELRRRRYQLF